MIRNPHFHTLLLCFAADNNRVLPLLGPYNLLKGPEWIEALGIPLAPPENPSGF